MTYTYDLARYVAWLVDQPASLWPKQVYLSGQDLTLNEMARWAEEATGRKFEIVYDGKEILERGEVTDLTGGEREEMKEVYALCGLLAGEGAYEMPVERRVRWEDVGVEARRVDELVTEVWGSSERKPQAVIRSRT